jgi:multiple sugar transport system substrate-binding protein
MNKRSIFAIAPVCLLGLAITACGGNETAGSVEKAETKPTEPKKEPFTLTIFTEGVKPEEFDARFRGRLEKKFPHITFQYQMSGTGATINDLVAQKKIPDIMRIDVPGMKAKYLDLGLAYGLDSLVKTGKYDLKRFDPVFIQEMVNAGRTGELYGLPVPPYFPLVLYYNKTLFDQFGVPYPKDGMSWDDIYELAKKMTRSEGGAVYRGFSASVTAMLRDNPYSLPILDPSGDQLADPEKWKAMFQNLKRFYDIPNNAMEKNATEEINAFGKGKVAMMGNQHNIYLTIPPEINWDIVSYPTLEGAPKLMGQRGPAYWAITRQSEHKEEAFQVIAEMLADDVQLADSKNGIPTTLVDPEIKKALGQTHPLYSQKNMKAVHTYPPTAPTPKRKAELTDVLGRTQEAIIFEAFQKLANNEADLNTALRQADERLKQEVALEKSKGK